MTLKSARFNQLQRLKDAGNTPFHSITSKDDGTRAVAILNNVLADIADRSSDLPSRLLPKPFGPNGPSGAAWGPFFDLQSNSFDPVNIRRFQRQAGNLEVDGKAGMNTLRRLDEIIEHIDKVGKPASAQ